MLHVALTGNIAAGKSAVADLFRRWGATVIDADRIVHQLQRPGTGVFSAIVRRFGGGVLNADGTLDRSALRRRVMADPDDLAALNAIVHPAVRQEAAALLAAAARDGARIVVSDIPLLFETEDPSRFDAVILVDAPEAVRLARLVHNRGLTPPEAARMMAAQAPTVEKRARSTYVIDNDGDLAWLERRAREVWDRLEAAQERV
ncbi:MAG TPA: dephospho-CoA kinase [Gemmatimonadales bacterium]|nr:dephospho-CoA kinase [Gemmatimonadales bacterium]